MQSPATYALNACIMFLYAGFYVLYFTVAFLDIAPKTRCPALWAGMGRTVRSVVTGVLVLPSVYLFEHASPVFFLAANAVLSIGVLLLLFFTGRLTGQPEAAPMPTVDERIADFSARYGLTPRERDVLAVVSSGESTLGALAQELGISERVFQRHLSSIYEKTQTHTRFGLAMRLYGISDNTDSGK